MSGRNKTCCGVTLLPSAKDSKKSATMLLLYYVIWDCTSVLENNSLPTTNSLSLPGFIQGSYLPWPLPSATYMQQVILLWAYTSHQKISSIYHKIQLLEFQVYTWLFKYSCCAQLHLVLVIWESFWSFYPQVIDTEWVTTEGEQNQTEHSTMQRPSRSGGTRKHHARPVSPGSAHCEHR